MALSATIDAKENKEALQASLQIVGISGKPLVVTAEELRKLPRTTIDTIDRQGQPLRYTGVALHHLLTKVDVPFGEGLREHCLRGFVSLWADEGRPASSSPE